MKRPWSKRIWFYKPEFYRYFWWRLWFMGNDEYHWETICIGFPWTGQVVIATKPFPLEECDEDCYTYSHIERYPGWPLDLYDWEEMTDEERARFPLLVQGTKHQH